MTKKEINFNSGCKQKNKIYWFIIKTKNLKWLKHFNNIIKTKNLI